AKSEGTREYADAKQTLEKLQRSQDLLATKIAAENIDVLLPKTSMSIIVDRASPDSSPPGILDTIRETINGGVHRSARIKIERDQKEIAGMPEKALSGSYDPYFM